MLLEVRRTERSKARSLTNMKTLNGKPMKLGGMYFDRTEEGIEIKKFCVGYCECGRKIGLTREQLEEFSHNMPGLIEDFIGKLFHLRILVPK